MPIFSEKDSRNNERIETLIGEQCRITGNLSGSGLLKIDGSVDGDILWQDDILLGSSAIYNGNIACNSAYISGFLKGNIICQETLVVESTGKISGDITVKKLVVKEGGSIDGKCTTLVKKDILEVLEA
ncbi:polymer-forming cytoskeletal protein [Clostridium sp. 19966]|uniref:bactofilin family protein n=1 Tax=Clostridium sp. 19966 TaxID=2768166 RepID=UPI0028DF62F5|nr:polymer-forming cytoskeletal protein [Clostridium sp. 19966]MDT8719126.1 polymer-forming cytoskeletal protein [Clostridium sp. 19966]